MPVDAGRLWLAVERGLPLAGVRVEMDDILGRPLADALIDGGILVRGEPSPVYPCSGHAVGCPRQVITHGDGSIIAVCGADPPECTDIRLRSEDIVLWSLSEDALLTAISLVLSLDARRHDRMHTVDPVWLVGSERASTRQILFSATGNDRRIAATISQVRDLINGDFVLLVPMGSAIGVQTEEALDGRAMVASLDRLLPTYERRRFLPTGDPRALLARPVVSAPGNDQAFAVAHTQDGLQDLSREQYVDLGRRSDSFQVFVDGIARTVRHRTHGGSVNPTQVQASYLRALRAVVDAQGELVDASEIDLPDVKQPKKAFQEARNAVDLRVPPDNHWLLFKDEMVGKHKEYRFNPDPNATFCLIFSADPEVNPS